MGEAPQRAGPPGHGPGLGESEPELRQLLNVNLIGDNQLGMFREPGSEQKILAAVLD